MEVRRDIKMDESIKQILMRRDGISSEDADNTIKDAKEDLYDRLAVGEQPYNICEEWFNLEPDYLIELMEC